MEDFAFAIVGRGSASFEGRWVLERAAEMPAFSHLGRVALSLLLAIGMSSAIERRKLTGQVEVDTERR
jgi:hypothetical protein